MRNFTLLVMMILLGGCFSTTPDSRFYLLDSVNNQPSVSDRKINVAVQDITVPEYLDRPQIVLQKQTNPELKISEFDRWASDVNAMLQNVMIENLQNALPKSIVKPLAYGGKPNFIVKINIEKFSGWLNKNAYIKGNWQIISPSGRIIAQQEFSRQHAVGKSYGSYVQTQSSLWAEISEEIATKLSKI